MKQREPILEKELNSVCRWHDTIHTRYKDATRKLLLLLLLSRFSRVRLCAAHQASLSLGFSRQEHWSGLPFPSPMHESEKLKGSRSVMSDSSNLMDYSSPGSPVHGIFQARVLEWGAIAYFILLPFKHFYWHTVALQYCVSFYCTAKWTGLSHTYIPSFWISFSFRSLQSIW